MKRVNLWTATAVTTAFLFVLALVSPQAARAYRDQWRPTALEIAKLPKYCQGQFMPALAKQPGYAFPPACGWVNHLCPGMVLLNRAQDLSLPRKDRQYALSQVDGELAYTRLHMTPTCLLAPDLRAAEFKLKILQISLK